MKNKKAVISDGFDPRLIEGATFEGELQMPCIQKQKERIIPESIVPFSKRKYAESGKSFVGFYEKDSSFSEVLISPDNYLDDFRSFRGIISPDCSLYWDMPLSAQIMNSYRNKAIGSFYQRNGIYVIPNVRWGDERSYTTCCLPEKFAFLGFPKNGIVSVGTYGCIRGKEAKYHFQAGLEAMLEELTPEIVLVYGRKPKQIFSPYEDYTRFILYLDWISSKKANVLC